MTDDDEIVAALLAAQAAVDLASQARATRRVAVMAALDAGLTKYRIAKILGVKPPTLTAIIETASKP